MEFLGETDCVCLLCEAFSRSIFDRRERETLIRKRSVFSSLTSKHNNLSSSSITQSEYTNTLTHTHSNTHTHTITHITVRGDLWKYPPYLSSFADYTCKGLKHFQFFMKSWYDTSDERILKVVWWQLYKTLKGQISYLKYKNTSWLEIQFVVEMFWSCLCYIHILFFSFNPKTQCHITELWNKLLTLHNLSKYLNTYLQTDCS